MKRHKIVLYNPQAVFYTMPLALLAVGSYLDPKKYDVRVIDGRFYQRPGGMVLAEMKDSLCLGVSVLTGNPIRDALQIGRSVKAKYPEKPIVWGGWHPSLFPAETMKETSIDVTVQGQGEATFGELVEHLALGKNMEGLQGITFRSENQIRQNPSRPLIDMNDLPVYNYDLIDVERYFKLKGKRQLDYISSTGCYFRCSFCADPFVFKRKWVALEPKRIGDEIEYLWNKYQFSDLAFQDETFFTNKNRIIAMAEEFLRRQLKFTWTGTMRADQGIRLSGEVMALCVRSGLRQVMIGVESGSQEMLDWMKKDITVDQVLDSAEKCMRHGISVTFPFIVGFPNETDASVQATLDLIKKLRTMSPYFQTPIFYFKPYPGSTITDEVVRNGYQLPETIEEWAEFDIIGSSGPWVTSEKYQLIERFKFYNRFAGGPENGLRRLLQKISRLRCSNDFYSFPIEKLIVEKLKPLPKLS